MKIPFRSASDNESETENPDWAKMLSYLYKSQTEIVFKEGELTSGSEEVVSETELGSKTVSQTLEDMNDVGLVDAEEYDIDVSSFISDRTDAVGYSLSEKGFDVAHDREQKQNQNQINRSLVVLTYPLVAAAMIQALEAVFSFDGQGEKILIGVTIAILAVILYSIYSASSEPDFI